MIRDYANHAANERTFLAWVRTGIAVIALGFVVEKFNLFVLTIGSSIPLVGAHREQVERHLEHLSGPLGNYGGLALGVGGVALIAAATLRFVRTEYLLDQPETHVAIRVGRAELVFMSSLILVIAGVGAYLAFG